MFENANMERVNKAVDAINEVFGDMPNGEVVIACTSFIVGAAASFKASPESCLELYQHLQNLLLIDAKEGKGEIVKVKPRKDFTIH